MDNGQTSFLEMLDATLHEQMMEREFDRKMDVEQHNLYEWEGSDEPWILQGYDEGVKNENGVYVENVYTFFEGKLTKNYVEIKLCKEGGFILYEFSYMIGNYGKASPLCKPCFSCHRQNSRKFLAEQVYRSFSFSVLGADRNVKNNGSQKTLLNLCLKACARIRDELPKGKTYEEMKASQRCRTGNH